MAHCVVGGADGYPSGIRTSALYRTSNLPRRFDYPNCFRGYGTHVSGALRNPLYRTTSMEYGWLPPSAHSVATVFRPRDNSFSSFCVRFGNYRNHSLNATPNPA